MITPIVEKLNSRGYWRVEIRPNEFVANRIKTIAELRTIVEKCRVELRGWDFPHLKRDWELPDSQLSISVETDFSVHVESWRAFLSGQFVFRGGIWVDWSDQHHFGPMRDARKPKTALPIVSSLWSLTEFLEFAARYAQTDAGSENMTIDISLHGIKGRMLFGDDHNRSWWDEYGPANIDKFEFRRDVSRSELIATGSKLALEAAAGLFAMFGWSASPEVLASIQTQLYKSRGGAA